MRIEYLKYILEIAAAGSISKASKNLYISHQSLNKILAKIEDELGVSIFERSSQGIILTEEGMLVKVYAEDVLIRTVILLLY